MKTRDSQYEHLDRMIGYDAMSGRFYDSPMMEHDFKLKILFFAWIVYVTASLVFTTGFIVTEVISLF